MAIICPLLSRKIKENFPKKEEKRKSIQKEIKKERIPFLRKKRNFLFFQKISIIKTSILLLLDIKNYSPNILLLYYFAHTCDKLLLLRTRTHTCDSALNVHCSIVAMFIVSWNGQFLLLPCWGKGLIFLVSSRRLFLIIITHFSKTEASFKKQITIWILVSYLQVEEKLKKYFVISEIIITFVIPS